MRPELLRAHPTRSLEVTRCGSSEKRENKRIHPGPRGRNGPLGANSSRDEFAQRLHHFSGGRAFTALVICTSPGPCCPVAQIAEVLRIAITQSRPFAAPGFCKLSLLRPFPASNPRVLTLPRSGAIFNFVAAMLDWGCSSIG